MTITTTSRRTPRRPARSMALISAAWLLSTSAAVQAQSSIIPTQVPELRPGVLAGYLPRKELPDSLSLLPAPPAAGSAAQAADDEAYQATIALRQSPRWALAAADANLKFPQAADAMSCALGTPINAEATPHLYTLLRRSLVDAGLATYGAKDHYKRTRPFVANQAPTCSPGEEAMLRNDGSYPSGHAALGWAWGLILGELAPDRSKALYARAFAFGQSRVICGVHWQSDVNQGRVIGAVAVSRLHSDPVFLAQMAEASKEIAAARAKALPPNGDCAAEAAGLKP